MAASNFLMASLHHTPRDRGTLRSGACINALQIYHAAPDTTSTERAMLGDVGVCYLVSHGHLYLYSPSLYKMHPSFWAVSGLSGGHVRSMRLHSCD
jgi:hypothetical protein